MALAVLSGASASAETLRVATYHTSLSRNGPGLLLRDLQSGDDTRIIATLSVIAAAAPDILVLQDMDYDADHAALRRLADELTGLGVDYPHHLALRPNTGRPTGVDIDGDGRSHAARDAHGYGFFNGQGGMAVLSRHPIGDIRDFSAFVWADLPGGHAADVVPAPALDLLRLHSVAAWDVQILTPYGALHLLTSHASPPVFDGPEDRNGRRNEDELRFWQLYLDGWSPDGARFAADRFAVIGTLNVDPMRGEGRPGGIGPLVTHPRLQDPRPRTGTGGTATADWADPTPGDLRVDYILPAAMMDVAAAGIIWPGDQPIMGITAEQAAAASDHRLLWLDLRF
ncbi:endonuclease/exonuclease/phosphatase family protein [Marivita sp.]|uniref:endonuclease/exonuclease/phosphatase family protein n=1 Tax=Marivita sp. TaxID=2003365 RepID=UPI0025BA6262|nr:endonuclease/exonuclease/phosphatase family protein [Marivita sp.]